MKTAVDMTLAQSPMMSTAFSSSPSFLCLSQESSAPKSLGAGDLLHRKGSFTAQTRRGWIPVTGTGMRVERGASSKTMAESHHG
jgi:hypothetical protein